MRSTRRPGPLTRIGARSPDPWARIQISPKGDGSELRCESEGQVGGVIAAVGSRLVEAVAKKMLDDFFRRLGEQLGG